MKNFISLTMLFCALLLSDESLQAQASLSWNKYDFVPGEKIILEDNQEGEVNGEFPSRLDLTGGGSVENTAFGDFNVIYFKEAGEDYRWPVGDSNHNIDTDDQGEDIYFDRK